MCHELWSLVQARKEAFDFLQGLTDSVESILSAPLNSVTRWQQSPIFALVFGAREGRHWKRAVDALTILDLDSETFLSY